MNLNWERLEKLLNMTTSSHDSEALTAIRRANEVLRQSQLQWKDVLATPQKPTEAIVTAEDQDERNDETDWAPIIQTPSNEYKALERAKVAMRDRVRSYPFLLRVLLLPIWIAAECYVTTAYKEPSPIGALLGLLFTLVVGAISAGLWVGLWISIAGSVIGR